MTRIKFSVCGGSDNRRSRFCPRAFYVMLTITIVNMIFQLLFSGLGRAISLMYTFYGTMFGMGNSLNSYDPYSFTGNADGGAGLALSDDQFAKIFNSTSFNDDTLQQMMQIQSTSGSEASGPGIPFFLGMGLFQSSAVLALFIFIIVVHTKTRNRIRRAYSIGNDMSCLGDCCCAFWCSACSICQMARHTANYHNTHRARCCTPTGLDEEWDDYDFLSVEQSDHSPPRSMMPMMV